MKYKDSDPFKVVIIRLLLILLAVNIACLIWLVRRDQRESIERSARIAQFQAGYIAGEAGPDAPEWIGG